MVRRDLRRADRWLPSSKACSACGDVKPTLGLAERVYRCGSCGLVCDRDLNAAANLAGWATANDLTPDLQRSGRVTNARGGASATCRGTGKATSTVEAGTGSQALA
jgi:putative transposase